MYTPDSPPINPLWFSLPDTKYICTSPKPWETHSLKWAHIGHISGIQFPERRREMARPQKPGELGEAGVHRRPQGNLSWRHSKQSRNNPPHHLWTDIGRGGFPSKPFLLGEIWMLSGGIFKLSMMTLARCICCSNASLSAPKDVRRAISLWSSGGAVGEHLER